MIDIKTKIHDKFSIEFKVGFVARRKIRKNDFTVGVWLFLPDSLDINSSTSRELRTSTTCRPSSA